MRCDRPAIIITRRMNGLLRQWLHKQRVVEVQCH